MLFLTHLLLEGAYRRRDMPYLFPTCRDKLGCITCVLNGFSFSSLFILFFFSAPSLLWGCLVSAFSLGLLPSFYRLFAVFGSFFLRPFFVLCSKLTAEWVFAISGVGV